MEKKSAEKIVQEAAGQRRQSAHAAEGGGHGGQHSGGMGGERGGDLHDVGSAQSGMTGGSGMGGNDTDTLASTPQAPSRDDERNSGDTPIDDNRGAEVQQSEQREGFGRPRGEQD